MCDAELNAACQELSDLVRAMSPDLQLSAGLSFVFKDGSWWVAPVGLPKLYRGVGVTFDAALNEFKEKLLQAGRDFLTAESEAYVKRTDRVHAIVQRYAPSEEMETADDGHPPG